MKKLLFTLLLVASCLYMAAATPSGTLPVLHIDTQGNAPVTSKEDYLKGTYYLDALGLQGYESIGSADAPLPLQIKGRGNYTWTGFDKKPYRLKLDSKAPLLGMNKSKHFALLAHADDSYGFMRNIVGFQLSRLVGMPWTPADKPVEVVLNGDYIGLYFLTETIRVDEDRVNIVEQPDEATGPDEITGGWLMEIDNYDSDPHVEITEGNGERIIFTYKTPEVLSSEQTAYLLAQVNAMNKAIYATDKSSTAWENLIDIDRLARFYIVQEVIDNGESFHGSCYLNKETGTDTKWMFGPVWDFGSTFNRDKRQYIYQGDVWNQTWIGEICRFPRFIDKVKEIWDEFYTGSYTTLYAYIDDYASRIAKAAEADARRWPQYGNPDVAAKARIVKQKLKANTDWLNAQWSDTPSRKYTWTAYFKDNESPAWNPVYAYAYAEGNANDQFLGDWPGTMMTATSDGSGIHSVTFTTDYDITAFTPIIIFGNGGSGQGNQTANLPFVNNAAYDRNGISASSITDITAPPAWEISVTDGALIITAQRPCTLPLTRADGTTTMLDILPGTNRFDNLPRGFYIVARTKVII